jgi:hypothetical protein
MIARAKIEHYLGGIVVLAMGFLGCSPGIASATEPGSTTVQHGAQIAGPDKNYANPLAPPPPCVTAHVETPILFTDRVYVDNRCAVEQRVKVVAAFAPDSECLIIGVNTYQTFDISTQFGAYFDGLEAC